MQQDALRNLYLPSLVANAIDLTCYLLFYTTDEITRSEVESAFCKCHTPIACKDVSTINLQSLSEILHTKTLTVLFNNTRTLKFRT